MSVFACPAECFSGGSALDVDGSWTHSRGVDSIDGSENGERRKSDLDVM